MRWLLLILLLLPLPAAATWPDTEEACDTLINDGDSDTKCLCNETLDWNNGGFIDSGTDPSNSTTRECATHTSPPGKTLVGSEDNSFTRLKGADTAASMPDGTDVDYIVRDEPNGLWSLLPQRGTFIDVTMCWRFYYNIDSGLESNYDDSGQRIKTSRNTEEDGFGYNFQMSWSHQSGHDLNFKWDNSAWNDWGNSNNPATGNPREARLDDCVSDWCRIEICWDHNAPEYTANSLAYRGKITVLSDPHEVFTYDAAVSHNTNSSFDMTSPNALAIDGFLQSLQSSDGYQYWSGFIQTEVPVDITYYPGPATEVEGDGGPTLTVTVDPTTEDSPGTPELTATTDVVSPTFTWDCDGNDTFGAECSSTSGTDDEVCTCPELTTVQAYTLGARETTEDPDLENTVIYTLTTPPSSATLSGGTLTGGSVQ